MKRFIISILFVISCVYGSPLYNRTNVDPICLPKLIGFEREVKQCINLDRFDSTAVQYEVLTNIVHYSGDEIALRQFSVKYCNVAYELFDCLSIYFNITPACQPIDTKVAQTLVRSLKKSLDFSCDNNAEAFVQLVINNGIQIITDNYLLVGECGKKFENLGGLNYLINLGDQLTEILCEKLKQVLICHNEWMGIHGNSYLINYVNGTYTATLDGLGC